MPNGHEPAFPMDFPSQHGLQEKPYCTGLSKREWLAGMAMQGLLSSNAMYGGSTEARDMLARDAIAHADALLLALDSKGGANHAE